MNFFNDYLFTQREREKERERERKRERERECVCVCEEGRNGLEIIQTESVLKCK